MTDHDNAETPGPEQLLQIGRHRVPEWTERALCAQTDPEAFFPDKGGSTKSAKAMCHRCLVAAECLDYALTNNERFGIWGGLAERERRDLLAQLKHTTEESA